MKFIFSFLILLVFSISISFSQGTQLLRQPTISSESIVFVYANDLWKVDRDGGDAIRLTTNEGEESLPHFSNDEKWIAFSAQYGGNTDVFIIPSEGGSPKRLTWHPGGDFVQGWTPEGEVMFRSGRESKPTQTSKFYKVSTESGLPVAIDIPRAAFGEISADGNQIAYIPITFWDPEWRNYRGGQAMPIWIVDMETKELIRTPQPTQERHLDPVWFNKKVFYLSERDYASNIWSFDPVTKEEKQHTKHSQFDVKSMDACKDGIIYEYGGFLHFLNPISGEIKQLEINVKGDMNFARERWENVTGSMLTNANISPNGKRAIFEYRGEIFSVPKEKGTWRNLTNTSGVADRYPSWSPNGEKVAWFNDESKVYKLIVADQYGLNKKVYDLENPTFYFKPEWSADGKKIAYTDTDYNIWFIELETGKVTKVATDVFAHPNREMKPIWSPDSKWIAYARQLNSSFKAIFVYNTETSETLQLTDGMADVLTPAWDVNGKYLYILASTNYGLNTGWLDMSSYDPQISRSLYCMVLSKDDASPILPKSDDEEIKKEADKKEEVQEKEKGKKKKEENESKEKKEEVSVKIDLDGLADRIVALNMPGRNYSGLIPGPENTVFVGEIIPNKRGITLHKYETKENKTSVFLSDIQTVVNSTDGKNLLYQKGISWSIVDTGGKPKEGDGKLKTALKIKIDPLAEYQQLFDDSWRFMRDFLYVNNVHGAPWDKVYDWYSPWVKHARHRTDMNYVIDIISGEVAIGHSYVRGGDMPDIDRIPIGLLGCDFEIENGLYKFSKIYSGESWNPGIKAPLSAPGIDVKEGDYLLAVNGVELKSNTNIYSLFEQTSGRQTILKVNSTPSLEDANEITVEPVSNEGQLRSINWIEGNRKKVDELSNGKLAYVYLPNTSGGGFASFNRYYFAQQDKKGVVLDERNNGGGSAADYMIDVMSRTLLGYFNSRANDNRPWTTPMAGIWGPKVMIINERAGSGGDLLPYMFKEKDLGPLIGTRTWGGLVGTWDTPPLIDGGRIVAPRGGFFNVDGEWDVEGKGISPDFEVIQEPKLVLEGKDPQLEEAVKVALDLLKGNEFQLKPEPAAPIRWKRPDGFIVK
ncbi:MAG: protease [Prolixibacteraceae bacterium]|jgi:tricorn protease|nr:protease [Prolixibacteraceae bacterium]MBT6763504.1 protease [Prolixibacteraceae bacterium]MBT6998519.1 protease [Prolixibacteraceae bacterium]MBT7394816.1 protease [Prolixibacteraceae bacterium]